MKRKRIIAKEFRSQAKEIFDYIAKDSPQNADKFADELLYEIDKIEKNPDANPPSRISQIKPSDTDTESL